MSVTRIGYASINVKDLASAVAHYTEIVGLRLVERSGECAYLQAHDAQDHHCLVLNAAGRAGLDHLGYKVNDPADLKTVAHCLRARGIEPHDVRAGVIPGQGEGVRFLAPSGHALLLYYHADKIGYGAGMSNPDPVPSGPRIGTTHLDHAVLSCEQPKALAGFMEEVLGFYVTERADAPGGEPIAIFMSCGGKMHDLAIVSGPAGAFHHMAFGVESRMDIINRTDVLKQRRIPTLELGVTRHGISGVTTVYLLDPSGNRNEFCHGAYLAGCAPGRVPPIVWPAQASERALFYYEGTVPAAFLSTVT